MREVVLPPAAPAMLSSLRAIGYSFEAALADIVDNSVAAGATRVEVQFRTEPDPYLAIIDNGDGIPAERMIDAMRHGGLGPGTIRAERDLGRFGLGLKTASLSQCRQLTVVSIHAGVLSAARWNLDEVERRNDWVLNLLDAEEAAALPHGQALISAAKGTLVLWQNFDRALAGESSGARALGELVDRGREHLALAFHRFLNPEGSAEAVAIAVNNTPIEAVDPFLSDHRSTRRLPPETLRVDGAAVTFAPFILPHISKLTPDQVARAGGEEGLRRNQGFYVYRGRRLITSGTWFRLVRQEELTKLARVRVDIPNSLDHLWALDVKKSSAHPPEAVRAGLSRVVDRITDTSRQVYRFRGRRTPAGPIIHAWDRVVVRGGVNYAINRDHPAVISVRDALDGADHDKLTNLLRMLEMALPADALYADMASERRVQTEGESGEAERTLSDLARRFIEATGPDEAAAARVLASLASIEPFSSHPALTTRIIESFRNAR
jgi:hypothetical protein